MAASHRLAIAKATFSAALLNPDEACAPLSRDDITRFHNSLEATVQRCSPINVERCKTWINDNVLPSASRVTAFGKFLNSISASYGFEVQANKTPKKPNDKVPSCQRKRLHLLYLVNDLLHQTSFHGKPTRRGSLSFARTFRPTIVDLVKDAASFDRQTNRKHHDRLDGLLQIWQEKAYFDSDFGSDLAAVMASEGKSVPTRARDGVRLQDSSVRDLKTDDWVLPVQHGEHGTPWYDLPAACWLPPITALVSRREEQPRRRRKGLNPRDIKPLHFTPRRVDPKLVDAIKQLMKDADRIFNASLDDEDTIKTDFDRLGQKVVIRKIKKGEDGRKIRLVSGETYYGWTRDFAEKMYEARKMARAETKVKANQKRFDPSESSQSSRSSSPDVGMSLKRKWDSNESSPPPRGPPTGPRVGSPSTSSRLDSPDGRHDPSPAHFTNQYQPPPPPPPMQQPYHGYPPPPAPPPAPGFNGMPAPPPPPPSGWQNAWPPAPPPPPNYQPQQQYQPQQSPDFYQQRPPPPPPPFQGYQQPWMSQGQPPLPPGQLQMPQHQQPYGNPNQNQGWTPPQQRGGWQQGGQRGRGNSQWNRGGNQGGYRGHGGGY